MEEKLVRNTDRIGCSAGAWHNKKLHMGRKSEKDDEIYVQHDDEELNACLNCKVSAKLCNGDCDIIKKIRAKRLEEGGNSV
jgi:hypothetical protein